MRNYYKIIVVILLAVVLFAPFYPVTVVPEWELQFVNKDGTPASSIRIDQVWEDYSLGWMSGSNSDRNLQTDSNGYIKLPARQIRVSIFQILSSRIRDAIMSINPHASFGADSFINCSGPIGCTVSYKEINEKPQRVILR
jgi:hypothetical protein